MSWIFKNRKGEEKKFSDKEIEELRSYSYGDLPDVIKIPTLDDKTYYRIK